MVYLKDCLDYVELYLSFCGQSAKDWDTYEMAKEIRDTYDSVEEIPDDEFYDLLVKYKL